VNWFDTAEAYGGGQSETSLARALHAAHIETDQVLIATKWMPALRFATSITQSIDQRLHHLGGFPISLYQFHNPMSFSSVRRQMRGMAHLHREKKIQAVGVSNFNAKRMQQAIDALFDEGFSLTSNQMRFSLLDRSIEKNGVLELARKHHVTIIAYSPLAQGLLTGRFHDQPQLIRSLAGYRKFMPDFRESNIQATQPLIEELKRIAAAHQTTPAQIALSWVIQVYDDLIVAIPGASTAIQAEQNARAMRVKLSRVEMQHLDEISLAITKK
jgi:aryl-alcohol dehydrogenase-like predicted oxidoreductase